MNSTSFKTKSEALEFAKVMNEKGIYATLERLSYWDELTYTGQWVVIWSANENESR